MDSKWIETMRERREAAARKAKALQAARQPDKDAKPSTVVVRYRRPIMIGQWRCTTVVAV